MTERTWTTLASGAETADDKPTGAHLRIVQDGPSAFRAMVRLPAPPPDRYRWVGPEAASSRAEAIAWCEAQVAGKPPPSTVSPTRPPPPKPRKPAA
jgi:hypothetical protein